MTALRNILKRRPTLPTAISLLALAVASTGTAVAATTGQLVNITDPSTAANKARVDGTGRLHVGDGAGPLTIDETPLSQVFRFTSNGGASDLCQVVAAPPAGKALVLKSLNVNVLSGGSSGFVDNADFVVYANATCTYPYVTAITPTERGAHQFNYEPGVTIPAGQSIAVRLFSTDLTWQMQGQGYLVAASTVPAVVKSAADKGTPPKGSPDPR